jgi:hypothetical protein
MREISTIDLAERPRTGLKNRVCCIPPDRKLVWSLEFKGNAFASDLVGRQNTLECRVSNNNGEPTRQEKDYMDVRYSRQLLALPTLSAARV